MPEATNPRLREFRLLQSNLKVMFVLVFVLTVSMTAYLAVRLFVLRTRMAPLEPLVLWYFAVAAAVLTGAQFYLLGRIRGGSRARIEALTLVDELTGVFNFRYLELRLDEEVRRAQRHRDPLSCIYLDFDRFKHINDAYGHDVGNAALRKGAETAKISARGEDFIVRLGGDEFLIVLPQTDGAGALTAAERIKKKLDAMLVHQSNGERVPGITFSIGIATFPADGRTRDTLVHAADQAMYRAKKAGGNQICTCAPPAADRVAEPCAVAR